MFQNGYLYDVTGLVSDLHSPDRAIIQFELSGNTNKAFLNGNKFYHNGKHIPENRNLSSYVGCGTKVKFTCHVLDRTTEARECDWYVTMCWCHDDSERNQVTLLSGMANISGTVTSLTQRQGTLTMQDPHGHEHKIHFLGSKFYLYGKRLATSKPLSSVLRLDDKVYFDATPCFPEENSYNCKWFATCVFKGKKPEYTEYKDNLKKVVIEVTPDGEVSMKKQMEASRAEDKQGNDRGNASIWSISNNEQCSLALKSFEKNESDSIDLQQKHERVESLERSLSVEDRNPYSSDTGDPDKNDLVKDRIELLKKETIQKKQQKGKLTVDLLQDIKSLTGTPRSVFIKGEGIILDVMNEDYGLILGYFKRNVLQTVLFHRSNAFLFKTSLRNSKLSEIFIEGDRVRFIAVGAPENFVTDWIASQVSVSDPD